MKNNVACMVGSLKSRWWLRSFSLGFSTQFICSSTRSPITLQSRWWNSLMRMSATRVFWFTRELGRVFVVQKVVRLKYLLLEVNSATLIPQRSLHTARENVMGKIKEHKWRGGEYFVFINHEFVAACTRVVNVLDEERMQKAHWEPLTHCFHSQ